MIVRRVANNQVRSKLATA